MSPLQRLWALYIVMQLQRANDNIEEAPGGLFVLKNTSNKLGKVNLSNILSRKCNIGGHTVVVCECIALSTGHRCCMVQWLSTEQAPWAPMEGGGRKVCSLSVNMRSDRITSTSAPFTCWYAGNWRAVFRMLNKTFCVAQLYECKSVSDKTR